MGKNEDDQANSANPISSSSSELSGGGNGGVPCGRCRSIFKIVTLRCVLVLVVGVAVFLSAMFWLPPFSRHGAGRGDQDTQFHGASVVASFGLQKSASLLNANIAKLQYDIFEEIGIPDSLVAVISLAPLAGSSNWTNVVFGIWPYPKSSTISSAGLSIIRENFMAFVTQQSTLHLTTSLFGNSSYFEVRKFPGGITIIPPQSAFLLQKVHILFNFTINFPIYKVQDNLAELKAQMKAGLLLNPYENLYVSLTNLKGSTVDPPTVVQTSIVLAVGNRPPSMPRLRQLAQSIRNSSDGNLGLNHTVFGKVKQIQLSSFLKHSLNSGGNGISTPPSPAPQPQVEQHNHHRHHQHHHHHSDISLAPAPAPQRTYKSPAPSRCHSSPPNKPRSDDHVVPASAPVESPINSPAPAPDENLPSLPPDDDPPVPSPSENSAAPALAPHSFHTHLPQPPSVAHARAQPPSVAHAHAQPPSVALARTHPPSESRPPVKHHDNILSISPSPFSSSVAGPPCAICWILVTLLYFLMHPLMP